VVVRRPARQRENWEGTMNAISVLAFLLSLLAAGTAAAGSCQSHTKYLVVELNVDGKKIKGPQGTLDISLAGQPRPVQILWIAPPDWVFDMNDVDVQTPGRVFTQGHPGKDPLAGTSTDRNYHWCSKNNDGGTYTYSIKMRNATNYQTADGDPVIVNDGPPLR
jgi:hypothetical protein